MFVIRAAKDIVQLDQFFKNGLTKLQKIQLEKAFQDDVLNTEIIRSSSDNQLKLVLDCIRQILLLNENFKYNEKPQLEELFNNENNKQKGDINCIYITLIIMRPKN
jgi:hypothetical protein